MLNLFIAKQLMSDENALHLVGGRQLGEEESFVFCIFLMDDTPVGMNQHRSNGNAS